ncbi:SLC26A/SulP transporter family protein [Rhizobacter sp. AJA081-3]|uniref:SulP family inorganic anion transporter n=1 Tax=Rhizobacter sp. AJA081-3 TaxID=2753607 RepID=UPI001ADF82AB|nr:SulP family inorganic anion transporter [Rhizobacter sp. AJA081-3]QTN24747.1 SLC26A/SulP transporter family protein [Rhizobacter sp. AJA081-3]
MSADRRRAPWPAEILGGTIGSVVMLAVVVTIGLLGYAPLGEGSAPRGLAAAFVSVTFGGVLFALFGRGAMPVAGPSSATALIFAGVIGPLVHDPAVAAAGASGIALVLAAGGSAVVLMGVLQIVFARLGLGRIAQFVPQPVLAGFMNGVAVLIFLSQLPTLLGLRPGAGLVDFHAGTLALGLATAACTWLIAWRWPQAPAQLIGLAFGLALYAGLHLSSSALMLGGSVGPLPSSLPMPELAWQIADPATAAFVWRHSSDVLTAAAVLALIGALESVLSGMAIDQQLDSRHDAGHDLLVLGVSNIVVGLFAGLPVVVLRARALATLRAGGVGRRSALVGALAFGAMYLLFAHWLALLPKAVLAGIMLTVAVALVDRWTRQLIGQWRSGERSADVWETLAIVAFVCAVTVWRGFAVGVAAGVLVTLVVFVRNMNRSLVRSRRTAALEASRRVYPSRQEDFLREARVRIALLELEGALFFGSAERLAREVDAIGAEARFVVLDLRGVGTIDASGAMLLQQMSTSLCRRGQTLMLAGVTAEHPHGRRLRAFGCFREARRDDWFADLDRAVEAAELQLLSDAGIALGDTVIAPQDSSLFIGLDTAQCALVLAQMQPRRLAAGEVLFREGDAADGLYVLTRGSITVVAGSGPQHLRQRFVSFSAGLMLGETAMLDGGGRSAGATADSDAEVFQLTKQGLDRIGREQPALAAQLYRNIAVHLSARLRSATSLRRQSAG